MNSDSFLCRIAHFMELWPTLAKCTLWSSIMFSTYVWFTLLPESAWNGLIWWFLGVFLVICTPYLWIGHLWCDGPGDVTNDQNDRKLRTRIPECISDLGTLCTAHLSVPRPGNSVCTEYVHEEFPCTRHTYMYEVAYVPGHVHESWNLYLGIYMVILEMILVIKEGGESVQNYVLHWLLQFSHQYFIVIK